MSAADSSDKGGSGPRRGPLPSRWLACLAIDGLSWTGRVADESSGRSECRTGLRLAHIDLRPSQGQHGMGNSV